ncbi:barstar family protein [Halomonas sp. SSL-5]|uniref:barstar family protein n=1 Tax=Halomonas sp. SSL-5 TaxID=3065855 RepID=UPI0027398029|nr:barstar family protein [Halomonas sp. SSL-5]MDY7115402.1 barstar family protein [Halomonas sp. SSL-5]
MSPLSPRDTLARFLSDPAHAGVYCLEASRAEAWHNARDAAVSGAAGLDWRRMAAPPCWSREALLDGLAESLGFPDYFGRNWDAAWDCLTELEWETRRALVVVVPAAPADAPAMAAFLALMRDAAEHWAARGHALVTLILREGEPPAWAREVPALPREATG